MTPELVASIFAGLVSLVVAVGALIASLRTSAAIKKDAAAKEEKLNEIHVLVDGRMGMALQEIAELRGQLAGMSGRSSDFMLADSAKADATTHRHNVEELLDTIASKPAVLTDVKTVAIDSADTKNKRDK